MVMEMDATTIIVRRVARELRPNTLVNLGIGMPTKVAGHLPPGVNVFFQSENGLLGMGPVPPDGMEDPDLTDAGGSFVTALAGCGGLRQRHVVRPDPWRPSGRDGAGRTSGRPPWTARQLDDSGKMIPGMGGAMDLVSGAKRVIVAMTHTAKGAPKILRECTLPLTSVRRISLVVTEMAVIGFTDAGPELREVAPGVSVADVIAATEAELIVPAEVPVMAF